MLNLLIAVLITYRVSQLITIDEGPFSLFLKLRIKAGAYRLKADGQPETSLGRGIVCVHCVGVYVALPVAFLVNGFDWYTLVYWLAIAGGSSFLWSLTNEA